MAKPDAGVFLRSVTWNSNTWNATQGAIQSIDFDKGGEPLSFWSGDNILPVWQSFVRQMVDITIGFTSPRLDIVEGEKASLVFVLVLADLTTIKTVTVTNMKLVRLTYNQSEATAGSCRARFVHESENGTTDPVTIS